jgi:hypothetical protein
VSTRETRPSTPEDHVPRPNTHDDDMVEVELKRGSAKIRAALKGLDAKKQKQVLAAVEVSVSEAVDQALEWAAEHVEEDDAMVLAAADDILRAAAASSDEPAVVGRVYGTLRLLGLAPDVRAAVKARRTARGSKAATALSAHLTSVQQMFREEEARLARKRR